MAIPNITAQKKTPPLPPPRTDSLPASASGSAAPANGKSNIQVEQVINVTDDLETNKMHIAEGVDTEKSSSSGDPSLKMKDPSASDAVQKAIEQYQEEASDLFPLPPTEEEIIKINNLSNLHYKETSSSESLESDGSEGSIKTASAQSLSSPSPASKEERVLIELCSLLIHSPKLMQQEGIFRIPAAADKLTKAKYDLDAYLKEANQSDELLLSGMIKHLFKLCYDSDREIIENTLKKQINAGAIYFEKYPVWFVIVLELMNKIIDETDRNQMSFNALSIVLGPNMVSQKIDIITNLGHYITQNTLYIHLIEMIINAKGELMKSNITNNNKVDLKDKTWHKAEKFKMPDIYTSFLEEPKEIPPKKNIGNQLIELCDLIYRNSTLLENKFLFILSSKDVKNIEEKSNAKDSFFELDVSLETEPSNISFLTKKLFELCYKEERASIEKTLRKQIRYITNEDEGEIQEINFNALPKWFLTVLDLNIHFNKIHNIAPAFKNKPVGSDNKPHLFSALMLPDKETKTKSKLKHETKIIDIETRLYCNLFNLLLIKRAKFQNAQSEEKKSGEASGGTKK